MKFTTLTAAATFVAFVAALPAAPRGEYHPKPYHLPNNHHHAPNATAPLYKPDLPPPSYNDGGSKGLAGRSKGGDKHHDHDRDNGAGSGGLAKIVNDVPAPAKDAPHGLVYDGNKKIDTVHIAGAVGVRPPKNYNARHVVPGNGVEPPSPTAPGADVVPSTLPADVPAGYEEYTTGHKKEAEGKFEPAKEDAEEGVEDKLEPVKGQVQEEAAPVARDTLLLVNNDLGPVEADLGISLNPV
jgi:hypothetical protein